MLNTAFLPQFMAFTSAKSTSLALFSYIFKITEKRKLYMLTKNIQRKFGGFKNSSYLCTRI